MSNEKFKNALRRVPQTTPPIWMMRQAGRYHKHYQNLRSQHSFMELCKNPELASEVAMGPIQDFDFDVSILFSDLLFPLEALGFGLNYTDSGPTLDWHLTEQNFKKMLKVEEALPKLAFQREAMKLTREKLSKNKSLIGFVGGPWTLFVYAVEGSHAGQLLQSKNKPQMFTQFCEVMVPLLIQNIALQFEGGAELVMIFDTAAGELAPGFYQTFVTRELVKLAKKYPGKLGYYSKGTTQDHFNNNILEKELWAGFGFDHRWNLPRVLAESQSGFIQGNFDQAMLFLETSEFKKYLRIYLNSYKDLTLSQRAGWICGLGHGVLPKTPEENVRAFVDEVREFIR